MAELFFQVRKKRGQSPVLFQQFSPSSVFKRKMRAINSNQQNHRKIHALSRLEKHVTEQIIYLRESVANVVFFLRSNYLKESE